MQLTIGRVSAMINAGVVIAQLTLPLALTLILAAFLRNRNTAITWSVVNRMLQKSLWPSILRTDSTSSRTQKRISTFSNASLFLALLTLIASIVTPLGLSDSFRTRRVFTAKFSHVVDTSVFGQGSTARGSYSTSRLCGSMLQQICPGQINTNGLTTSINRDKDGFITEWELDDNDGKGWIDARVPSNITDVFTSAGDRYGESVAGLFDIQYRNYQNLRRNVTKMKVNNGEEYTQGVPRFLTSHVLEDDYILVEGLVLDMKNGGVGFRNHTAPEKAPHGATWVETLLWVKPETVCVCNNLTIDYTVEYEGLSAVRLTDRGGFQDVIDARRKYSVPPKINRDASQENPELYHRAWRGALSENLGQLLARNISYKNVSELPGKAYDMSGDLALTNYDVSWPIGFVTAINSPWTLYLNSLGVIPGEGSGEHLNLDILCTGFGGADDANITNIAVGCGTILGIATRSDSHAGTRDFMNDIGSQWSHPIYTCSSTLKASLKRVKFSVNENGIHTGNHLDSLQVVDITDVEYPANDSEMPLWAVEYTGMPISEAPPLWGLIGPEYETHDSLFTKRSSHLYLPAMRFTGFSSLGSIAGAEVLSGALKGLYGSDVLNDYTGRSSYSMAARWKELTRDAGSVAVIPNLIWTDVVANIVVSTKTAPVDILRVLPDDTDLRVKEPTIDYNPLYAIPAILLVMIWTVCWLSTVVMLVSSRVSMRSLAQLLNQTSTGRAVSNILEDDTEKTDAPTREWVKEAGGDVIGFTMENVGASNEESEDSMPGVNRRKDLVRLRFTKNPMEGKITSILGQVGRNP